MILSLMKIKKPPYRITKKILNLVASISQKLGEANATHLTKPPTNLRKKNRIKTIQASLEIEGNSLTVEQITAIIEKKRVMAPEKDILEVQNAIGVYERMGKMNPNSLNSFCKAHKILMKGLIQSPGKLRNEAVGIIQGSNVTHLAPPIEMVYPLMKNLFEFLSRDKDLPLIKSCVFHYEMEFIHPFSDGNGRMGRLWQTLILKEFHPVFEYLPMENLIKERQAKYYQSLRASDKLGESTPFIEFMLEIILQSLEDLLSTPNISLSSMDRINIFKSIIKKEYFARKDYLRNFKEISSATASRDLKYALDKGIIRKKGEKNKTVYQYK